LKTYPLATMVHIRVWCPLQVFGNIQVVLGLG
jgi:hypothetical protein